MAINVPNVVGQVSCDSGLNVARRTKWEPANTKPLCNILYNVGPTSKTLGRRCANVIQMFCVCWATISNNDFANSQRCLWRYYFTRSILKWNVNTTIHDLNVLIDCVRNRKPLFSGCIVQRWLTLVQVVVLDCLLQVFIHLMLTQILASNDET